MGKNSLFKKAIALTIITVFFTTSILPTISGIDIEKDEKQNIIPQKPEDVKKKVTVTCYNFGMPGEPSKEIEILQHEAEFLYGKIKELNFAVVIDPLSEETQQLQIEIVDLADEYDLLPAGLSKNQIKEKYLHVYKTQNKRTGFLPQTQSKASEFLCTFVSTGSGGVLPIIALPRLIPILMIPIPRLFMIWRAQEAVTSCGGLRSGTGFIAYGQQNGIALGFWGLGFTFSLPPLMGVYGLAGYSLYASVNADAIEFYPPNSPPVISQIDPYDGEINVPLSLLEIRFQIFDYDGDLMSYTVTTTPDIGLGSGNLKPDGVYSVPVSGLEDLTDYSWHIEVTDGMDTTVNDFIFTTEAAAPIISNLFPPDGSKNIPIDLSQISFTLTDYQGDPIDWTGETAPDIGSGSGTNVGNGEYTFEVSGIDYSTEYRWYVNATDGEHWTYKEYTFKSRPPPGQWWNENWGYRKEIIVDSIKVIDQCENFPLLIHIEGDNDIALHAQNDGDDIVITDYSGTELYYEFEFIDIASGNLVLWVNIPNLNDETILYVYYGNSECASHENIEGTWDTAYKLVLHMSGIDASTIFTDSSDSDHIVTVKDDAQIDTSQSKIGASALFDGSGDYLELADNSDFDYGSGDFTISAWALTTITSNSFIMAKDRYEGWWISSRGDMPPVPHWHVNVFDGDSYAPLDESQQRSTNQWYYVTLSVQGSKAKLFVNDIQEDSTIWDRTTFSYALNNDKNLTIATCIDEINHPNGYYFFNGNIDEVRISKGVARSAAWISASYNNQNDPSSFMSIGPEEPAP